MIQAHTMHKQTGRLQRIIESLEMSVCFSHTSIKRWLFVWRAERDTLPPARTHLVWHFHCIRWTNQKKRKLLSFDKIYQMKKNLPRSDSLALPSWWGCNPGHVAYVWRHGKWPQSWRWHNMVQSGLYCDFFVDLPWSHSELQGPPTGSYNHRTVL